MGKKAATSSESSEQLLSKLNALLENRSVVSQLEASGSLNQIQALEAVVDLAEQAIRLGIDYRTLGLGWHHPQSRSAYRKGQHKSIACEPSRKRAAATRENMTKILQAVADGEVDIEKAITETFVDEIGLVSHAGPGASATFSGVSAALRAELLLPLRALNECDMPRTMCGAPLPVDELKEVVRNLTGAVLSGPGGFSEWRYSTPTGQEQLRGLSEQQIALWREPKEMEHTRGLRTHEDGPGELGFFWATKIGGPSHGFDYEGQCILPLLANARHKVLLVSDPKWPAHPTGRAHFRFLWSVGTKDEPHQPQPRLWLETVNCDFDAPVSTESWDAAVLAHAISKADSMQIPLSVESYVKEDLKRVVKSKGSGAVRETRERMLLRPSTSVVEASDYLSHEHDWVQKKEEITHQISRTLYVPASSK